jgi:hypothetical protein
MNVIRVIKSKSWAKEATDVYRILMGKVEEKTPIGISTCRWKGHIKTDPK